MECLTGLRETTSGDWQVTSTEWEVFFLCRYMALASVATVPHWCRSETQNLCSARWFNQSWGSLLERDQILWNIGRSHRMGIARSCASVYLRTPDSPLRGNWKNVALTPLRRETRWYPQNHGKVRTVRIASSLRMFAVKWRLGCRYLATGAAYSQSPASTSYSQSRERGNGGLLHGQLIFQIM